jgi:hypothetical protein
MQRIAAMMKKRISSARSFCGGAPFIEIRNSVAFMKPQKKAATDFTDQSTNKTSAPPKAAGVGVGLRRVFSAP